MTKRAEGLRAAEVASEAMLHKFGALSPGHIKVEAYASAFGLTIIDGQLDGARARLTRGKKPQIRVSERTPSEAARRFSIAHELGHHVLELGLIRSRRRVGCVAATASGVCDFAPAFRMLLRAA